ncbi:MAG: hypothetical protein AAFY65_01210 [Pseudomonadota bacterium]
MKVEDLLADMKRIQAELGPPPPRVRLSKHVPALVAAQPRAKARTDDMRTMVDDLGPQRIPGGYQIGDTIFINPIHFK